MRDSQDSRPGARGSPPGPDATPPRARKRGRAAWIGIGVAVAVIAVAAVGFSVWHDQPSFCNAICHEPMDPYVEGFYSDDATLAAHHAKAGKRCLDCHVATLDDQISEARSWMAGSFETGPDGKLVGNGMQMGFDDCAKGGCHDYERVVAKTADWGGQAGVNPHYSHQFYSEAGSAQLPEGASAEGFAMDCTYCHSSHGQSVMYCNSCHSFKVPAGWIDPAAVK